MNFRRIAVTQLYRSDRLRWGYALAFLVIGLTGLFATVFLLGDGGSGGSVDNAGLFIVVDVMVLALVAGHQLGPKIHRAFFRPAGSVNPKARRRSKSSRSDSQSKRGERHSESRG